MSIMDSRLQSRINNVEEELKRILEPCRISQRTCFGGQSPSNRILKKWKYRPRDISTNRFINHVKMCPYENVVVTIKKSCPRFNLHSYDDLMHRCARIQDGSTQEWLDWDDVWINPISLSSKGWDFDFLKNGTLTCNCITCSKALSLKLTLGSGLNRRYWEKYVSQEHSIDCPWRRNQFDLSNEYYLQPWNLIREFERINRSKLERKPSSSGNLQSIFGIDDGSWQLLLRGYQLVATDVVRCTGCFKRAFVDSVLRDKINYHAGWCKYGDSEKLRKMIERSTKFSVNGDINGKLKLLESYFENV